MKFDQIIWSSNGFFKSRCITTYFKVGRIALTLKNEFINIWIQSHGTSQEAFMNHLNGKLNKTCLVTV